jgi:hypothetical protein
MGQTSFVSASNFSGSWPKATVIWLQLQKGLASFFAISVISARNLARRCSTFLAVTGLEFD